jgi:hypothetical protein
LVALSFVGPGSRSTDRRSPLATVVRRSDGDGRYNENKRTFAVTARRSHGSSIAALLDVPKVSGRYKIKPIMILLPADR